MIPVTYVNKNSITTGMADDEDFGKCFLAFFKSWIPDDLDVDVMMALDSSSSVKKQGFNKGKAAFQVRIFRFCTMP